MRRRYRQDLKTGKLHEVRAHQTGHKKVAFDGSNFRSIVDGTVISSERKLREHNAKNDVEQVTPETEEGWAEGQRQRDRFFAEGNPDGKADRVEQLNRAYEDLRDGRRRPENRRNWLDD